MKVGVIGSRQFDNYNLMCETLKKFDITTIVSGRGGSADKMAEQYAKDNNIETLIFPADWKDMSEPCIKKINKFGKPYNSLAGFKRNTLIVQNCDFVIAFWDGVSSGSKDSINKAKNLNKEVIIINF